MNLLNPWAIGLGAIAIAAPIVIHLLTKPRPVRLPLSTIRFVRDAVRQRRSRSRLRDWIVLLLRTAAVALLGLAFARPLIGAKQIANPADNSGGSRVIIVDSSLSMEAVWHGIAAFDKAKGIASNELTGNYGAQANVIFAAAQPRPVFDRMSGNLAALRSAVSGAQPRPERLDIAAAINMAAQMLASQADAPTPPQLIIVSDFQRTNWASVDFSPLPKRTIIVPETVAPPQTPANLAVLRIGAQGRLEVGRQTNLQVDVGNYSDASRDAQVELNLGDATYHLSGVCPAGQTTTLTTPIVPSNAGWLTGFAKLDADDALAADNTRSCVLEVREPPVFLMVTRQPEKPQPISSHYLERALAPMLGSADQPHERVVRASPDSIDLEAARNADVIVLDHPGKLSHNALSMLVELVRHGKAMLYVAAERTDAENLKQIATLAGNDLKMPVEFEASDDQRPRHDLFLTDVNARQSPFTIFGDELASATGPLRFGGGLDSRPAAGGLAEEVLASLNDRSAFLMVTPCGAGRVAVLNADLSDSNLPASPAFVPLMGELTQLLMSRRQSGEAYCGERMVRFLPPQVTSTELLSISSEIPAQDAGQLSEDNGSVVWTWKEAGPPGIYSVKRNGQTVFAVATATPAEESYLASLDPSVLKDRLAGGRTVEIRSPDDAAEKKDKSWAWLLSACVGCVLLEIAALRLMRT